MSYRLTETDSYVIRDDDGATIPRDDQNVDWRAYQAWLADGNTPTPYEPPSKSDSKIRLESFLSDSDRKELIDQLKNATPVQIKTYVTNNVTDLASARALLTKLVLAVAVLIRE